jgi:hypothetical protein
MIEPFLTAYDPSDLPGGSVDPLGFDRGYALLADKILPGLTNVANRPRYFTVMCAAIAVSDDRADARNESPRECRDRRLAAILRAERFWTLACLLAANKDPSLGIEGIRGIRYVQRALGHIEERGDTSTDADFLLLSRQMPYGLVGIYGSIGDELGIIDRKSFTLGPDLGRRLALSFIGETRMPDSLQRAIAEGGTVGITTLTSWGALSHVNAARGVEEHRALEEALVASDVRRRMANRLSVHLPAEGEHEILRLRRVLQSLASSDDDADLREAIRTLLVFEECYRLLLLGFQRLLWMCQNQEPFTIDLATLRGDAVLGEIVKQLPAASEGLTRSIDEANTPAFKANLERLSDAKSFVNAAAHARDAIGLVECILARHRNIQHAKFDGGRRKMPWLEVRDAKVMPTLASAMRVVRPPERTDDVLAHPYRTFAADQFRGTNGAARA